MKLHISPEKAEDFLGKLDPKKLVDLTADLLSLKKHTDIKIVDGTGDGCRDIYSIDSNGEKHLTQCKFHKNLKKTISSKELGELPLGLVKFGYKKGLFCTNSKISPQSKREYIDNYPNLDLEFWEGSNIASIVFEDVIIRSIWYDGKTIDRISYVLIMPALARDIYKNKPLSIMDIIDTDNYKLEDDKQVHIRDGSLVYSNFEPYLPPKIRTIKEGWGYGRCTEIVIQGPISFDKIYSVQKTIAENLIGKLSSSKKLKANHIALRLGKPHIAPLSGESAGAQLEVESQPLTIVKHGSKINTELEWIIPTTDNYWFPPLVVRTSIADWARWYNPKSDICLDLNIRSKPSIYMQGIIEEQYEYFLKWWNKSIFALIPNTLITKFKKLAINEPSEILDWYDNQSLCSWRHGNLSPGIRHLLLEPDDEEDIENEFQNPFEVDQVEYEKITSELKIKLENLGAKLLDPIKARHMIASKNTDPFLSKDVMIYRSIDLMYNYSKIPSPIDPESRYFILTKCWLLNKNSKVKPIDELAEAIKEYILNSYKDWSVYSSGFDNDTLKGTFYILYLERKSPSGIEDTNTVLNNSMESYNQIIIWTEKKLKSYFPDIRSATKEFWSQEISISFPNPN